MKYTQVKKDRRLALIIGVSEYEFVSKLRNPVNAPKVMNGILSILGFKTLILNNPIYKEFKSTLFEITDIVKSIYTTIINKIIGVWQEH